jgi:sterol desaturase/sphingolipid hydroxylase (fatty acid hydroxylase superfamily)
VYSRITGLMSATTVGTVAPGLMIFLAGCALYYVALAPRAGVRRSWSGLAAFILPAAAIRSASVRIDLVFYVLSKIGRHFLWLTHAGVAVLTAHFLGAALSARFGGPTLAPPIAIIALAGLCAFLLRDLVHYVVHRLHHQIPALWALHKVHHAATWLTPLTAERTHPLEDQIFAITEGLAIGVALGLLRWRYTFSDVELMAIVTSVIWGVRMAVLTPLQHSSAAISFGPLDRIVYSPSLHQVHHSARPEHWDRNFGECLSLWDSLFGTYRRRDETAPIMGLPGGAHLQYETLAGCYLAPLSEAWRRLWRPSAGHDATVGHPLIEGLAGGRIAERQFGVLGLARVDQAEARDLVHRPLAGGGVERGPV